MLKNYLKVAWRNLVNSRIYSFINIIGLATGMAAALIIGLWVWDEVSFDTYHHNYKRLARVMVDATAEGGVYTGSTVSQPMGYELQNKYGSDFKHVALVSWRAAHILAVGDKQLSQQGMWAQDALPEMFSLHMLQGGRQALKDPSSLLLSASAARALFGDADPMNKMVRVDNRFDMKVAGVYKDLPHNTTFNDLKLILPWTTYANNSDSWIKAAQTQWENHMCQLYVQLNDHADIAKVNARIKSIPTPHISFSKEELQLHPMSQWRLHNEFSNGKLSGGRIRMVWLTGIIGAFILLLACINFMNLSTARSEKRSREVGIRKAVGSLRGQLIGQFLSESLIVVMLALVLSIVLVQVSLPFFNNITYKTMTIPWSHPLFWVLVLGFAFITGLISGSYPAFYLSAFEPVKVLKGTFRAGRFATLPRKVLVVAQFTISVALITSTLIVYRQIQHARQRPVGYTREGLITVDMNTPDIHGHYDAIRNDLLRTGVVADMAQSNSAPTEVWSNNILSWRGKDPGLVVSPGTIAVSHDFGTTLGWKIIDGRDFSRSFASDTGAFIMNEAAVKLTGFKHPVGEMIRWGNEDHLVIGVVKDMVMESPYEPVKPTIFHLNPNWARLMTVRIKPDIPMREGLAKIAPVFKKYNPGSPFVYKFVDSEYAAKFSDEERIGHLATIFAILAIFISCLGLYGLASFVAEQRTKEIGIRKVMGASVFNLWKMLSKDFVGLVMISCVIAIPLAWYLLHLWLQDYTYRTTLSWWIFAAAATGALIITLMTVSYQAFRAAVMNPVRSLKAE
ncbi:ABC transporter permease [uncultured Chitinophaga sp.]|jgi:ABC-type antimicrobial peptide transport system, permease component|uniref:ABC transporter permease n=1 Tax=uncultured Chitinophaga sp. TaxID=339340 RepID=UPI00262B972D|nr:ABC transporter permease [uncultured Chitinophaga sp.]